MTPTYRIDPHVHTSETSKCARVPAVELAEEYHALGIYGIAITDHLNEDYISQLYCMDDWNSCIDSFLDGYRRVKERGDKLGLIVILGMEIRFPENDNDYLVYGIDEMFLRSNPYIHRSSSEAFYKRYSDKVVIIQAHPFRDNNENVCSKWIHGLEIVNSHPRHENHNEKALAFWRQNPRLYRMCGSDVHRKGQEGSSYVLFDHPVTDSIGFKEAVEQGNYSLESNKEEERIILRKAGIRKNI